MFLRFSVLILLLLTVSTVSAGSYIIHAGRMIDVTDGSVKENMSISVAGTKISNVQAGLLPAQGEQQLVDLTAYTVMPGLMDMHTHLSAEITRDYHPERFYMDEADYAFRSVAFAERTLMAGFTTVRDVGELKPNVTTAMRDAIIKGYIVGPRIYTAGKSIATTGGHADPSNGWRMDLMGDPGPVAGVINGADDARKAVRQRYKEGADLIKLTVTGGVLSLAKSSDNPQFTDEEIAAIMDAANDYNFVVAVHAHGVEGMKRAIRAGVHSVEHGTYMDREAMRLMKKHGTFYVPTISAGKWVAMKASEPDYYPEIIRPKAAAIGPQIQETFAEAYRYGVKIAFGTDAAVFPHGLNAMEFEYMVEAGMPPMEAIQSATKNAATLLRIYDEVGSIETGKLADIVAVKGDPLTSISLLKNVRFVMKEGEIYKND